MDGDLRVRQGGSGQRVLLLLHGLGATSDVWNGVAHHWPGRWLAPDLPGHGGSRPLPDYTFESLAAGVAQIIDPGDRVVVLGHSLGGVIGLTLAGAAFDAPVDAVVGLGIKVAWTVEELERGRTLAQRSPAWFASRDVAASRYLRVSGLAGLLGEDDPAVAAGLREENGRWRLALDPAAFGVGGPDMPGLLARSRAAVTLARGEHDAMVTDEQLADLDAPAVTLAGLGHNAHVEDPGSTLRLLEPYWPVRAP